MAVRFRLYSTSICFVCSHFAAGQREVLDRNADYSDTLKRIRFPLVFFIVLGHVDVKGRNIYTHDAIFWLGDFNYRIDMSGEEVKRLARTANFAPLIERDQLTVQKSMGQVLFLCRTC